MRIDILFLSLLLSYQLVYGNAAEQIASNNETIDLQTQRVQEDNLLQEKDIKIRTLITVLELNLIFLEEILNRIEIDESEQ